MQYFEHKAGTPDLSPYRSQLVDFICQLVRVPSEKGQPAPGAPFGVETVRALDVFLSHARELGFRTGTVDGYAGYAEWGPVDAPLIAAVCHLDVVPAGDWAEAYQPVVTGDRLIGRGSNDDKGPAATALYALKYLMDSGFEPKCRYRVILGLDEESGSECMAWYTEHADIPVAAFTPDADFPVIAAEKGILHARIDLPLSTTKDGPGLVAMTGGTRPNVICDNVSVTVRQPDGSESSYVVNGKAGHGAHPEQGINAISLAMKKLADEGVKGPAVEAYRDLIGMEYDGTSFGIACEDEPSGPLTLNVGIAQVVNDHLQLTIDIRHPVSYKVAQFVDTMTSRLAPYGGKLEILHYADPINMAWDHPLVSTLMNVYNRITGSNENPLGIGGGTYSRSIPNTVAFGPVFPGYTVNMHQTGEEVDICSLLDAGAIYVESFKELDAIFAKG